MINKQYKLLLYSCKDYVYYEEIILSPQEWLQLPQLIGPVCDPTNYFKPYISVKTVGRKLLEIVKKTLKWSQIMWYLWIWLKLPETPNICGPNRA